MFSPVLAAEVAGARCLSTSRAHGPGDTQWLEPALHREIAYLTLAADRLLLEGADQLNLRRPPGFKAANPSLLPRPPTTRFRSDTYFRALRLRFRVAARERSLVKRAFRMESRAPLKMRT